MDNFIKKLTNLLNVKSIVTLVLTGVFAFMAIKGTISQDFMTIYAVIIAFYFGTQSQSFNVKSLEEQVTKLKDENNNMADLVSSLSMPTEIYTGPAEVVENENNSK